jgi:hypothetical protein
VYTPPPRPPSRPRRVSGTTVTLIAGVILFAAVVTLTALHIGGRGRNTTAAPAPVGYTTQPVAQVNPAHEDTSSAVEPTDPPAVITEPTLASGVVPSGYTRVVGPVGVQVSVPSNWPTADETLASVDEVDDPSDQDTYLRYGGSASAPTTLMTAVQQIEVSTAGLGNDYQRLSMTEVTSPNGDQTVEWQFLFTKNGVRRHAVDWFWRVDGNDYAVYAATPVTNWQQLQPVVQVLEQTAGPV